MKNGSKHARRARFPLGFIFGLILIWLGMAMLLDNLHPGYAEYMFQYWPCAPIALGLARLWNKGLFDLWGQTLLVAGVLFQIACLWNVDAIELWWPLIVVWVGLIVVVKAFLPERHRSWAEPGPTGGAQAAQSVHGGQRNFAENEALALPIEPDGMEQP